MSNKNQVRFLGYLIGNFFDTFLVFWLSFLTVGLFSFLDKHPAADDAPLPDLWEMVYEHIFLFSQYFVPVLLGIYFIISFAHKVVFFRIAKQVVHAWIFDSTAIMAGALLGSIYLNEGYVFFLDITLPNVWLTTLFSFLLYAAGIATVSIVTYFIQRFSQPKREPVIEMTPDNV